MSFTLFSQQSVLCWENCWTKNLFAQSRFLTTMDFIPKTMVTYPSYELGSIFSVLGVCMLAAWSQIVTYINVQSSTIPCCWRLRSCGPRQSNALCCIKTVISLKGNSPRQDPQVIMSTMVPSQRTPFWNEQQMRVYFLFHLKASTLSQHVCLRHDSYSVLTRVGPDLCQACEVNDQAAAPFLSRLRWTKHQAVTPGESPAVTGNSKQHTAYIQQY